MIRTVLHAGIVVTEMEKVLEFYRDLLGLKVVLDCEQQDELFDKLIAHPGAVSKGEPRHMKCAVQVLVKISGVLSGNL